MPRTGKAFGSALAVCREQEKAHLSKSLDYMLCEMGHKVAVLAIDPSSHVTGGSVLGDKTRMEALVEPSERLHPSITFFRYARRCASKTRETMLLCEAAGYDIILIETVGVGQSETAVRDMVDFFMLLVLTGAGDDLQGMKKGIMESADLIVHKADGENKRRGTAPSVNTNKFSICYGRRRPAGNRRPSPFLLWEYGSR